MADIGLWNGDVSLVDDHEAVELSLVDGLLRRVLVCCDCGLVHLMSVNPETRRAYFVREDGPQSEEIRAKGRAAGHTFPRERYDIDADHDWALWNEKWRAAMDLVGSQGERLAAAEARIKEVEEADRKTRDEFIEAWKAKIAAESELSALRAERDTLIAQRDAAYEIRDRGWEQTEYVIADRDALRSREAALREALERFKMTCRFGKGCTDKRLSDRCDFCHARAALAASSPGVEEGKATTYDPCCKSPEHCDGDCTCRVCAPYLHVPAPSGEKENNG